MRVRNAGIDVIILGLCLACMESLHYLLMGLGGGGLDGLGNVRGPA